MLANVREDAGGFAHTTATGKEETKLWVQHDPNCIDIY